MFRFALPLIIENNPSEQMQLGEHVATAKKKKKKHPAFEMANESLQE